MYYFYILRCRDNSLYSGISTDPKRREKEHNTSNAKASRYTRSRRPVRLVYVEQHKDMTSAMRREREIKRWSKKKKEASVSRQFLDSLWYPQRILWTPQNDT
ncbi:GIY-YIG nuclease family protein [Candidatus Roizmanbacteria bacterium]|nr:GIY-YIG nuclease family protein [Candidatus Roizmanbacteria bacterium]